MNQFIIEVLEDGKIKVTSPGGFDASIHKDADDFLQYIKDLAGGPCETKKLQPTLGNAQQHHHHHHGKGHHHH